MLLRTRRHYLSLRRIKAAYGGTYYIQLVCYFIENPKLYFEYSIKIECKDTINNRIMQIFL